MIDIQEYKQMLNLLIINTLNVTHKVYTFLVIKSVTHLIRVCNYFCGYCGNFQTRKPLGGGDPGAKRPTLSLYIFLFFFFAFCCNYRKTI